MRRQGMKLDQLTGALDTAFGLSRWGHDPAMSHWVPHVYRSIGYDYTKELAPGFCTCFNGLMLRSADTVAKVYCASFPTPDILEKVLGEASRDTLLFLHHPVDLEVSGAGFLPIPPAVLRSLKARRISIYACHAPMDCHQTMGTTASIAQALELAVEKCFDPYDPGFSGVFGTTVRRTLDGLVSRCKEIFDVARAEIGGARPAFVSKVAIVAGGADSTELMAEAEGLGAQAYITGEWYPRTSPPDDAGRAWAEANLAACKAFAARTSMALLGFSHPATEFLVMKRHMEDYFRGYGLPVESLPQADWWR
jgi:putative NIF3 family GTP cyclohydrolase 1 type 2